MKNLRRIFITTSLTALLAFGSATAVFAAEGNTVTTSGTGIISVEPDTASISLTVQTIGKTSEAAKKENNKISAKVVAKLEEMGIAKDKIITNYSSVYPEYQYDEKTKKSTISGYRAHTSLQVKVTDIDNVGSYIDAALNAGATGFNGASFSLENPTAYYTQALQLAVKNASTSANTIAAAYGKALGPIQTVVEHESYASFEETAVYNEKAMDINAGTGNRTVIQYDKIDVTATITATYGL